MDNFYLTDEDIHGLEEDKEEVLLKNKIEKLEEKNEIFENIIKTTKHKIELNNKINFRCLKEELNNYNKEFLKLEIKKNNELLELLNYENEL